MTDGTLRALKELQGYLCRCGHNKQPRRSFCGACFHRLPDEMQRALYKPLAEGYVEAYQAAFRWLEEHQ